MFKVLLVCLFCLAGVAYAGESVDKPVAFAKVKAMRISNSQEAHAAIEDILGKAKDSSSVLAKEEALRKSLQQWEAANPGDKAIYAMYGGLLDAAVYFLGDNLEASEKKIESLFEARQMLTQGDRDFLNEEGWYCDLAVLSIDVAFKESNSAKVIAGINRHRKEFPLVKNEAAVKLHSLAVDLFAVLAQTVAPTMK